MKHIKYFISFILIFFLLDTLLYHTLDYININQKNSYGSLSDVYKGTLNVDALFVGSSRIGWHVDPQLFTKETSLSAYNLGMNGSNFEQHSFLVEEYLIHNKTPKILFFEFNPRTLDIDHLDFNVRYFKPFIYYSDHTKKLFYKTKFRNILSIIKSQAFNNRIHSIFFQKVLSKNDPKSLKVKGAELKLDTMTTEVASQSKKLPTTISKKRMEQIESFLQITTKQHIDIILVTTPYYKNAIFDQTIINRYYAFINDLTEKYKHVTHFDYMFSTDISNQQELFWDHRHLNIKGAQKLTKRIANDYKAISKNPSYLQTLD